MGTVGQTRDRGPTLGDDEDADDSNRSGQSRGELGVVVIWWSLVLFPSSGSLVIGGLVVCCLVVDDEFRRLDSTNDEMMRMMNAQPEESHRRQEFVPVVPVQFLGDRSRFVFVPSLHCHRRSGGPTQSAEVVPWLLFVVPVAA